MAQETLSQTPGWELQEIDDVVQYGRTISLSVLKEGVIIDDTLVLRAEGDPKLEGIPYSLRIFEQSSDGDWRSVCSLPIRLKRNYILTNPNSDTSVRDTLLSSSIHRIRGRYGFRNKLRCTIGKRNQIVTRVSDSNITLPRSG